MSNDLSDWYESLGASIESAAECLPKDYQLIISIEKHGYSTKLKQPNGLVSSVDRESIVDEIEALTAMAAQGVGLQG